ncbi:MAG TPA: hypothetical protein VG838_11325 [Opitutaceae bacterium]|nr:hypothetical protein [Opitutaceae bacterium]
MPASPDAPEETNLALPAGEVDDLAGHLNEEAYNESTTRHGLLL